MKTQDAYNRASSIDQQINDMLGQWPISGKNWQEWLLFTRTVSTTLHILEKQVNLVYEELKNPRS